jgi:hypothetical protein
MNSTKRLHHKLEMSAHRKNKPFLLLPNLLDKRKKFYSSIWVCRGAISKTWGINPKIALWMYKAIYCQNYCMQQQSGGPW